MLVVCHRHHVINVMQDGISGHPMVGHVHHVVLVIIQSQYHQLNVPNALLVCYSLS
jgi:hypothetical protein